MTKWVVYAKDLKFESFMHPMIRGAVGDRIVQTKPVSLKMAKKLASRMVASGDYGDIRLTRKSAGKKR